MEVIENGRPELGGWLIELAGEGQVRLEAEGEEFVCVPRLEARPLVVIVGVVGTMGVCMLVGRFILLFVLARTGKGDDKSLSLSVSRLIVLVLLSEETCSAGKRGGRDGGIGASLVGASLSSRSACILEKPRGSWKPTCSGSGELGGIRVDSRFDLGAVPFVGEGVSDLGDLGGMLTMVGLVCSISKVEFRCLIITGVCFGACFGEIESLTGESGLVTFSAVGGGFRLPLRIESRGLVGRAVTMVGRGGVLVAALFIVEYRLPDEFGTLKFGVPGE